MAEDGAVQSIDNVRPDVAHFLHNLVQFRHLLSQFGITIFGLEFGRLLAGV